MRPFPHPIESRNSPFNRHQSSFPNLLSSKTLTTGQQTIYLYLLLLPQSKHKFQEGRIFFPALSPGLKECLADKGTQI